MSPAPVSRAVLEELAAVIESRKAGEPNVLGGLMREIEIPDSHHHVMIDQPMAFAELLARLVPSA